jgi:hypothetical protein
VRKRKRLLTVLAAGSAFVGGGVALGQASPSVSPAPTAAAAISSAGGGGQGLQLSTLDDHAKVLAAQIASIREQVDRIVAERSATAGAGDPVASQGGTQQVGLGPGTSSVASGSSSLSPATHATTGASTSSRAKPGSAAPGTHGTTGASGSKAGAGTTPPSVHGTTGASAASTAGGSPSGGGTDRYDDGGSAGMDR